MQLTLNIVLFKLLEVKLEDIIVYLHFDLREFLNLVNFNLLFSSNELFKKQDSLCTHFYSSMDFTVIICYIFIILNPIFKGGLRDKISNMAFLGEPFIA
jgi:hypothetical protein